MTSADESLIEERSRRTRAVCEAIERVAGDVGDDSVRTAAGELWSWLDARYPEEMGSRTRGGLEEMTVPSDQRGLVLELHAATRVCDSLSVYYSADTSWEMERDAENVRHDLATWRRLADQRS